MKNSRPKDHWRKKYKPERYRNAPSCGAEQFKAHILDFENNGSRRKDRNDKITESDASAIFSDLQRRSHTAERNGRLLDIFIVHDWKTQQWRGFKTNPPDASLGIERNTKRHDQLKDSHRTKLGDLLPCSKEEAITTICERYKCDIERAKEVFRTCINNRIFLYHEPTRTWRGCYCDEMPTEKVSAPFTRKQDHYMQRYGATFPPLAHDYRNPDQSPIILALAKFDGVSTADALKTYKRTWTVSRDKEKTAFVKDKATGLVRSRNYVAPIVLTEEQKAALANVKAFENKTNFENECARILNIALVRIDRLKKALEEAKAQGLWKEGEIEGRYLSPERERPSHFYAGKNLWERYKAKKAQDDEDKRLEDERLEADRLAKSEERVRTMGNQGPA
jgi:hypothetical protein